jgi:hypothetical protein
MAQLGSPGVQVNVIDESFYNPATPGTIPLVLIATAQDKTNASGTGVATGTSAANANVLYLATSQKDLTDRYGTPIFQKDASGNAIQGSELNEYGLFSAYSYLGASNSAYILRAPVDLGALVGQSSAPVGNPETNSYWVDTSKTRFGIFEWNSDLEQFTNKVPLILNKSNEVVDSTGYQPKSSVGVVGDYAVVTYNDTGSATSNDANTVWYKNSDNIWVKVNSSGVTDFGSTGSAYFQAEDWVSSSPVVSSRAFTAPMPVGTVTYTEVSGTANEDGTGAKFNVVRENGVYTSVTVAEGFAGSGYIDNEVITILGTALGGTAPTNNLVITVDSPTQPLGALANINLSVGNDGYTPSWTGVAVTTSRVGMKVEIGPYGGAFTFTDTFYVDGGSTVGASLAEICAGLKAFLPTTVSARIKNNKIEIIAKENVAVKLSAPVGTGAVSMLTPLLFGVSAGTYNSPAVAFSEHTRIPFWSAGDEVDSIASNRPSGSVWVKTTEYNLGAKWTVKRFNGDTLLFETKSAPVYTSTASALYKLDPLGGGTNISINTLFVNAQYTEDADGADANFKLMYRNETGPTTVTIDVASSFETETSDTITISETVKGSATLNTVVFNTDEDTIEEFVAKISDQAGYTDGTSLVNVTAEYNSTTGKFTLTHALGGEIYLTGDTWTATGMPLGDEANVYAGPVGTDLRISNWKPLSTVGYAVDATQPTDVPADNTLWYASYQNQVDIMVHNGTSWVGYKNYVSGVNPNGPFVQATKPTIQSDNTALVDGDLWVDTSDQDMYGRNIKRWNDRSKTWDAIDVTDHTSQYGIIFADARWATTGASSSASSIKDLLTSNFVDFDAPDPTAYPRGMMLWNTRRSGFNIKQYKKDYINTSDTNPRMDDIAMTGYFANRWVSVSGQDLNQVAHMGRKAQRAYVVGQLKVAINTNQRILDEDNIFFNLIAAPGYPELISDMVNLNSTRNGTALVVGDTPLRLESNANSLINYGTDYANTGIDGEDGLHTNSDHLAVYYPSGLTTDLTGTNVVVPPSHMMLRTIALSDQRSFQWFAPAGTRRGGITNATSVGYLQDGSFIPVSLNQATRDQMAQVKINPITNIPGAGLVAFGQYTKTGVNSSLDRINVARLVSYLRRQLGIITKPFIFEPNDKQTRSEIKNVCESLMLDLVSLRGIYDFIVVCDETNNTPSVISNNQLYVDIAVEPVKAVEFIYIPLRLKNVGDIKARN